MDPSLLLQSYWTYALGVSGGYYATMRFYGGHLSDEAKSKLSLWLSGKYDSTWSQHFCDFFDRIFGAKHLSWRCFSRSAILSVVTVFLIWLFVDPVLGLLEHRTTGDLDLWQALLLGALINIIPDYLSLLETRWLIHRFGRVRSIAGQVVVLIADIIVTGAIIWLSIAIFLTFQGATVPSVAEYVALFSIYAIFFYSTFATSVWVWIYLISTWLMRLFCRTVLGNILNIEKKPVEQLALVSATVLGVMVLALSPTLEEEDGDTVSWFDRQLCRLFPETCHHVVRLTENEEELYAYYEEHCGGVFTWECLEATARYSGGDDQRAFALFEKICAAGNLEGCSNLGWMFVQGIGVPQDEAMSRLESLQTLELWKTEVSDLTPLAELESLQTLTLWGTEVSDLTPLAGLESLQTLFLGGTQVSKLEPLAGLESLQELFLWGTQVSNLEPLAGLESLQTLVLRETEVSDLTPVEHIEGLRIIR